jgi:hypothetical protein
MALRLVSAAISASGSGPVGAGEHQAAALQGVLPGRGGWAADHGAAAQQRRQLPRPLLRARQR